MFQLRKEISLFTLLFFCLFTLSSAVGPLEIKKAEAAVSSLTDVKGNWAEKQIKSWNEEGLTSGYQDGTFKPDEGISRAEFITLLNRVFNTLPGGAINYADVNSNDWFYKEIAKAKAAGFISGYQDNTMKPEDIVSREEVAAILNKVLRLDDDKSKDTVSNFKDSKSIASWSKDAINSILAKGFMKGYPDRNFKPTKLLTRAEAIAILDRVTGIRYAKPGIYGPEDGINKVNGNITLTSEGITLRNTHAKGDLILAEGIGSGEVTLKNIQVTGDVIVKGQNTEVNLINGRINNLNIYAQAKILGAGHIENAKIYANGVNISQKVRNIIIAEGVVASINNRKYKEGTHKKHNSGSLQSSSNNNSSDNEYDKEKNEKLLKDAQEVVSALFKDDEKTELADNVSQEDIDNVRSLVETLSDDVKEKASLLADVNKAQELYASLIRDKVRALFKDDGKQQLVDNVSQEEIDDVRSLVESLSDDEKEKASLLADVNKAQELYVSLIRDKVNALFKDDEKKELVDYLDKSRIYKVRRLVKLLSDNVKEKVSLLKDIEKAQELYMPILIDNVNNLFKDKNKTELADYVSRWEIYDVIILVESLSDDVKEKVSLLKDVEKAQELYMPILIDDVNSLFKDKNKTELADNVWQGDIDDVRRLVELLSDDVKEKASLLKDVEKADAYLKLKNIQKEVNSLFKDAEKTELADYVWPGQIEDIRKLVESLSDDVKEKASLLADVEKAELKNAQKEVNVLFKDENKTELADWKDESSIKYVRELVESLSEDIKEKASLLADVEKAELKNAQKNVNALFKDNEKTELVYYVDKSGIDKARSLVELLSDNVKEKVSLLKDIEKAQELYMPILIDDVNDLFKDKNKTELADNVGQWDIYDARKLVESLKDSVKEKASLLKDVEKAQELYMPILIDDVNNLFKDKNKTELSDYVGKWQIENVRSLVELLSDDVKEKASLLKDVEKAELKNAQKVVNALFKDANKTELADDVREYIIENAKKLVKVLSDDVKEKDSLLKDIKKADAYLKLKNIQERVNGLFKDDEKTELADWKDEYSIKYVRELVESLSDDVKEKASLLADVEKAELKNAQKKVNALFKDENKTELADYVGKSRIDKARSLVESLSEDVKEKASLLADVEKAELKNAQKEVNALFKDENKTELADWKDEYSIKYVRELVESLPDDEEEKASLLADIDKAQALYTSPELFDSKNVVTEEPCIDGPKDIKIPTTEEFTTVTYKVYGAESKSVAWSVYGDGVSREELTNNVTIFYDDNIYFTANDNTVTAKVYKGAEKRNYKLKVSLMDKIFEFVIKLIG